MRQLLNMHDFSTFRITETDSSKKYLHECKDSDSESGYSLLVHVDATHAGIVNGNARFYRPDLMASSTHTWGDNKRTKKPVLAHHDADSDPLGRVATWKYIDLRHEYVGKYGEVNNLLFYSDAVRSKKMDLFKSVNWVYDNLQRRDKNYVGLGKIQLGLSVTNPDAIAKVQRGEYATVSVGFSTDAAVCSVCHQDWAEDGKCEHKLGSMYDGRRCFLVSGNMGYQELSFVTFPADKAGVVVNFESVKQAKDSLAFRAYLLGKSLDETAGVLADDKPWAAEYTDMLASDIHVATDADEEQNMNELETLQAEIKSSDLTQARALELRKQLEGNKDAKRLLSSLNAKIRKNSWDSEIEDAAPTKEEVEARIATADAATASMTEEEKAAFYEKLKADAAQVGLDLASEPAAATAATEVPVLTGTDKVLASLKSEGLVFTDSDHGKTFVQHVEDLNAAFAKLPDEEKYTAIRLIYSTYDILGDQQSIEWMKKRLQADPEQKDGMYDKREVEDLHEAVDSYEAERTKLTASVSAARDTNKNLIAQLKRSMATSVVMYSVLASEAGFAGLDAAGIEKEISERSQRQLVSLQDSVKDLQRKLQVAEGVTTKTTAVVEPPATTDATAEAVVEGTSTEGAAAGEISDTAKVTDSTDQPTNADSTGSEEPAGQGSVNIPFATLDDIRALRTSNAVSFYRQLKNKNAETK
jgi:hypothetical protein